METPDILVLGGGIIGCSLAYELARAGCKVTLLEAGRVGCAASSAAAGMLVPAFGEAPVGPFVDLCHQSAALYESWINELRENGAGDVGYRRAGLIEVWTNTAEAGRMRTGLPAHVRPHRRAEWLSREQVHKREPAFLAEIAGASFYPDDAQVTPGQLVSQVARLAEVAGVHIRDAEPVLHLAREGDRVRTIQTARSQYQPGLVVLTAGAWSGGLASSLGWSLPTRPVKGQLLSVECRVSPVRTPLHAGETLFVPRPDGRLIVGVTMEEGAGYDDRPTLAGISGIMQRALALVPALGKLHLARAWAGLRPATPDGLPFMGPVTRLRNLWVSTGHFRKGILLAPICARLMARSILANKPVEELKPFLPER